MGKKRKDVAYDKRALKNLIGHFSEVRMPLRGSQIPRLNINMEGLEKTIKALPKKEREVTERYWGLIPGTPIRAEKRTIDLALKNMREEAYHIIITRLISFEYLYYFDANVKKLVENIVSKIDKTGYEEMSDLDIIKYFTIFLVFIGGGHQMVYEAEGIQYMTEEEEKLGNFDKYALLKATWDCTTQYFQERSISLRLIIGTIEMFDLRDVIAMKKYVGLPIDKEYEELETASTESFWDIRLFKEKLFPYGPWYITSSIIYGRNIEQKELEKFCKQFSKLRADWNSLNDFRKEERREDEKASIKTTKGKVIVPYYEIGKLGFTDSYEIISLYVNRNFLM